MRRTESHFSSNILSSLNRVRLGWVVVLMILMMMMMMVVVVEERGREN
jgi:hypothetical protein